MKNPRIRKLLISFGKSPFCRPPCLSFPSSPPCPLCSETSSRNQPIRLPVLKPGVCSGLILSGAFYPDFKIGVWRRRTYQCNDITLKLRPYKGGASFRYLSSNIHWTNLLIRSSKSFILTPLSYLTYHERGPLSQKFISFYTFIRILQKSLEELVIIILGLYRSERKRR